MSAIQALAPSEPVTAREGENAVVPGLRATGPPAGNCCGLRILKARPDQVREARQFVREHLAGHPAAGDAALVASELAANSVMHSASRLGGRFVIRVTVLDCRHAAVTVTDQGGTFAPRAADQDGESGRGLVVIRALACLFSITGHDGLRTFTAIIDAGPDAPVSGSPGEPAQVLTARAPTTARFPTGACP